MIDPKHKLPITKQYALLSINRSYYSPAPESEQELALMRVIDELYLERPTRGSRSMRDALEDRGFLVGRHRVRRLMRKMGIEAFIRRNALRLQTRRTRSIRIYFAIW